MIHACNNIHSSHSRYYKNFWNYRTARTNIPNTILVCSLFLCCSSFKDFSLTQPCSHYFLRRRQNLGNLGARNFQYITIFGHTIPPEYKLPIETPLTRPNIVLIVASLAIEWWFDSYQLLEWWLFDVALQCEVAECFPRWLLIALDLYLTTLWHLRIVAYRTRGYHRDSVEALHSAVWILQWTIKKEWKSNAW